jgi:hypothetical protein
VETELAEAMGLVADFTGKALARQRKERVAAPIHQPGAGSLLSPGREEQAVAPADNQLFRAFPFRAATPSTYPVLGRAAVIRICPAVRLPAATRIGSM